MAAPSPAYTSVVNTLGVAHQTLHAAKAAQGLTYAEIGKKIGHDEVWVAALFFGQARATEEDLQKLSTALYIPLENLRAELAGQYYPNRGIGEMPPKDPLIYRLYEIVQVFGWPLKAIINEKFGDGIMSAIDFRATVDKVQEQGADRVVITLNGKWLKHTAW